MHRLLWFMLAVLLVGSSATLPVRAAADQWHVTSDAAGVRIMWRGNVERTAANTPTIADWPQVDINGVQLPAQLLALRVADNQPLQPIVTELATDRWGGKLAHTTLPQPAIHIERTLPSHLETSSVPDSPLVVLRDSRVRGQRIVVVAVSPVFGPAGDQRAANQFNILIPGATLWHDRSINWRDSSAPFLATAPAPVDHAANGPVWKITVAQPGVQRLSGTMLAAAGLDLATLTPAHLHLRHADTEIALHELGTADGRLDPADELRFYAPPTTDRWNSTSTYWLSVEPTAGARMTSRSVAPGSAPLRNSAIAPATWYAPTLYDSTLPGPDGDHWFAADLRTGPGLPAAELVVPLTPTLPLVAGTTVLTITGSAYTGGTHHLSVRVGTATATVEWQGTGDWSHTFTLPATATNATLTLVPATAPDGVEIDRVEWKRAAALQFGGRGAEWQGEAQVWRYQLRQLPPAHSLYDVSSASAPQLLALAAGPAPQMQDSLTQRHYLLTDDATLPQPDMMRWNRVDWHSAADALYIAPAAFHAALQPLLNLRQQQGRSVRVIDVQAIYDAWSAGQVAPEALRSFLRYAAATWNPAPLAVTLVGDGTYDPLNYTAHNNTNFIPPYLALVDPWIGETACETCYAQLDGDDVLSDSLPDLLLGRLPVKNAAELTQLVAKLVRYETTALPIDASARMTLIADNGRNADGTGDAAGDFATYAERIVAQQPLGMEIQRLYYDPWGRDAQGQPLNQSWREADAERAHQRTLELLDQPASIISFIGHADYWRWASTALDADPPHLLGLYDVDAVSNAAHPAIVLEMTCLTAKFDQPAFSGTTIDERWLLHGQGGAVGVWGPTGLGVAYGHDQLSAGFYAALWATPPHTATLGALIQAGYERLFTSGPCCQATLRTFALLGDPLTVAQVRTAQRVYLPQVRR